MERQVIVLDEHRKHDGRISRHLNLLKRNGYTYARINFNNESMQRGVLPCWEERYLEYGIKPTCTNRITRFINRIFLRLVFDTNNFVESVSKLGFDHDKKTIIHVHDPSMLMIAFKLSKRFKRSVIVYDRHEYYEIPYGAGPKIFTVNHLYEKVFHRFISGVVAVTEEHKKCTERYFPGTRVIVVQNYPDGVPYQLKSDSTGISKSQDSKCFSYIGSLGWNADRDIRLILKLMNDIMDVRLNVSFIIGGFTNDEALLRAFDTMKRKYGERFDYVGYVSREETQRLTAGSHFGFLFTRPDSQYWVETSANKVFEYLQFKTIPIIRARVSNSDILQTCSLIFDKNDSYDFILNTIIKLIDDDDRITQMMASAHYAAKRLSFETEGENYLALYEELFALNP